MYRIGTIVLPKLACCGTLRINDNEINESKGEKYRYPLGRSDHPNKYNLVKSIPKITLRNLLQFLRPLELRP